MITINGKTWVRTKKQFDSSKSQPAGYYRIRKRGILFMDNQKQAIAYLAAPEHSYSYGCWFVSATPIDKKIWYSFGLAEHTAQALGIESLSFTERNKTACTIWEHHGRQH